MYLFVDNILVVRYPDDVLDRVWSSNTLGNWKDINTTAPVNTTSAFEIPQAIISKASIPKNASESFSMYWQTSEVAQLYLHFAEIQVLKPNNTREFDILLNEFTTNSFYCPPKFMADTVPIRTLTKSDQFCTLELVKTKSSSFPPSLNAVEVFEVLQLPQLETDENDG